MGEIKMAYSLDKEIQVLEQLVGKEVDSKEENIIESKLPIKSSSINGCVTKNRDETMLLTKICCGCIQKEEIESSNISTWHKNLLWIAYYEKNCKSMGIKLIKELKRQCENELHRKILNMLFERLTSRRTLPFNGNPYVEYMSCQIDFNLIKELQQRSMTIPIKQDEGANIHLKNLSSSMEKEARTSVEQKKAEKFIVVEGERETPRYQHTDVKKKELGQSNKEESLLIKDVYRKECSLMEENIYLRMHIPTMREKAIEDWDKLKILMYKSSSDEDALMDIISLLERLNKRFPEFISINKEKNRKLLQKTLSTGKQ